MNEAAGHRVVPLLLAGIVVHCFHVMEEFVTRFHERFPQMLGLEVWSDDFFVTVNLGLISLFVLSAIGLQKSFRPAYVPVWFLAIAMVLNGVAHPALAIRAGGYFPGLVTSPVAGVVGVFLFGRLWKAACRPERAR